MKKQLATRELCETDHDFYGWENFYNFFPITTEGPFQGDEIVVFDSSQVLPRYVVHYTIVSLIRQPLVFFHLSLPETIISTA